MWKISRGLLLIFLIVLSCIDIRNRRIPVKILIPGVLGGIIYQAVWNREDWIMSVMGIGVGSVFLLISKVTCEGIGYGDSIVILILGIFLGGRELVEVLSFSFCILVVFAIAILCRKNMSRKYEVPFLPFLTGGYICYLIGNLH